MFRKFIIALLASTALLLTPAHVAAAQYYVSNESGNDANSCADAEESSTPTNAEMKKTIQGAIPCMTANGDRISLVGNRDGSVAYYDGPLNRIDTAISTIPNGINTTFPTYITANPAFFGLVVVRPPDDSPAVAIRVAKSYLKISNLVFDCVNNVGSTATVPGCVQIYGGGDHIVLDHVEVRNHHAIGVQITDTGADTTDVQIKLSYIHDNTGNGVSVLTSNFSMEDTDVYSNGGIGLSIQGSTNADTAAVNRSKFRLNTGYGVVIGDNTGGNSNTIVNSLVYGNTGGGIKAQGTSTGIYNNVTYNNTAIGILVAAGATSVAVVNDICYLNGTNLTDSGTSSTLTTNMCSGTNPLFTDASGGDFTLQSASTARNTGTTIGSPPSTWYKDYRKSSRTSLNGVIDIGAYEMPIGCAAGVCTVANGGDFQGALYQAACGDTIKLTDGSSYQGNFTVPSKNPCTTYTTITRTGTLPSIYDVLPNCYVQGPTFAAEMVVRDACLAAMKIAYETNAPKLYTDNTQALAGAANVIGFEKNADYWKIVGVEIHSTNTNAIGIQPAYVLVEIGNDGVGGIDIVTLEDLPDHIVMDRISIHGNPTLGGVVHAVFGNGSNVQLINSLCYGIKADADAQCYLGYNSPGPVLIENNYLEATGENVLFGGSMPTIPNMTAADIIQTRNYMTKNWTFWTHASRIGYTFGGEAWTVKNVTECKNCRRNYVYNNVLEGSWEQNQNGPIVLFQSVADGNSPCMFCTVKDIYVYNNVIRHGGGGFQLGGKVVNMPTMGSNINMTNNLMYDIARKYSDTGTSSGYCLQATAGGLGVPPPFDGVTFEHNTCDEDSVVAVIGSNGDRFSNLRVANNLTRSTGDAMDPLAYFNCWFIFDTEACGGAAAFNVYSPGSYTVTNNANGSYALHNGVQPPGNWFITPAAWNAIFTDVTTFNYLVVPGSVYKALGANDATDNTDLGVNLALLPGGTGGSGTPSSHKVHGRFGR